MGSVVLVIVGFMSGGNAYKKGEELLRSTSVVSDVDRDKIQALKGSNERFYFDTDTQYAHFRGGKNTPQTTLKQQLNG